MLTVLVPPEYHAALAAPLAVRGIRLATGPLAELVFGRTREPSGLWLALTDGEAAAGAALDAGADDAVTTATEPALIAARIGRLLQGRTTRFGDLELDPLSRTARRNGRLLTLLPREFALLSELARHAGRVVSRPALHAAIWARDYDPGTNVIEVHISRLRAELDREATPMLWTERGRGYRLVVQPAIAGVALAS